VLPRLNGRVVEMAVRTGLALGSRVKEKSVFARKNYFYPDLPKGYQISQYERPLATRGAVALDAEGSPKTVRLNRIHLEEDAGKSMHDFPWQDVPTGVSLVDLNRAGTPLIEIVSEPDLSSAEEAYEYLVLLRRLVRWVDASDGNMEEGSLRCDANVSVRKKGATALGTKVEIKNLNSFQHVKKAIEHEVERQVLALEAGQTLVQETRLYEPATGATKTMRSKEESMDYRYFPDPDLPPLVITEDFIRGVEKTLPELPDAKRARFMQDYGLTAYDAGVLTASRELADYYEQLVRESGSDTKIVANWVTGELAAFLNRDNKDISASPVTVSMMTGLLKRLADNTISGKIAKEVFEAMWNGEGDADAVIAKKGLKQITDTGAIEKVIDEIIAKNPKQLEQYRAGKEALFGYFVGQVMKATQGKANPAQVNELLKKKLRA
jgi:aspartyl-tRNA(Asn)/glutamyl-tRNA(Gln) amidotransferase subunit B